MKLPSSLLILFTINILMSCNSKTADKTDSQAQVPDSTSLQQNVVIQNTSLVADTAPKTTTGSPDFNILRGEWMRMDGGYVISISDVAADGSLKAAYFNPNPIKVESTKWEFTNNFLYVMVKLQDVNYPGSTYTLQYFPEVDKLAGVYFQAMEGNNYDVVFERKK